MNINVIHIIYLNIKNNNEHTSENDTNLKGVSSAIKTSWNNILFIL
jgi:hypothetical protein